MNHLSIGETGEKIAAEYLLRKGYTVLEFNYRKPWGEIDIVTQQTDELVFVEVKTYSGTPRTAQDYRPEENIHPKKIERLERAIQTYLLEHKKESEDWRLDAVVVYIDKQNKNAHVRHLKSIF